MIRHIICATDFSENAKHAVRYAARLAGDTASELTLFHAYHNAGPVISSKEIMTVQPQDRDQAPVARDKMQKLVKELRELNPDLRIDQRVEEVNVVHGLLSIIKNKPAGMVVMGSRGWNELKEKFFGGSVKEAIHELPCPVLAIPEGVTYAAPRRILYAAELEEEDVETIKQLTSLAGLTDAEIYIAHFFPEDTMDYQQDADAFKASLREQVNYPRITFTSQTYGDLMTYIEKEVRERKADWLVVREREHGFWHDLFHKDVAEKLIDESDVPLLIYNDLKVSA